MRGYALFESGRLGALWFSSGVRTPSGIHVGSTLVQLVHAYGYRLTSEQAAYDPGGRYYFLRRVQAPRWELRFDVNARSRITQIGFGGRAVRYVEGCA